MRRNGFTVVEACALAGLIGAGGAVVIVVEQPEPVRARPLQGVDRNESAFGTGFNAGRATARKIREEDALRGIGQSLTMWSEWNVGRYPLPSDLDRNDWTVAEQGRAKNTTANVFSSMVYQGLLIAEMFRSPLEVNENIREYVEYEVDEPRAAVDPVRALWDPGMREDFTSPEGGHISFAHPILDEARLDRWKGEGRPDEILVSARGPEIASADLHEGGVVTRYAQPGTLTNSVYRSEATMTPSWSGQAVLRDGSVRFFAQLYGDNAPALEPGAWPTLNRADADGAAVDAHDVLFYDEGSSGVPGGDLSGNRFLGIFTSAGDAASDFTAIWD